MTLPYWNGRVERSQAPHWEWHTEPFRAITAPGLCGWLVAARLWHPGRGFGLVEK